MLLLELFTNNVRKQSHVCTDFSFTEFGSGFKKRVQGSLANQNKDSAFSSNHDSACATFPALTTGSYAFVDLCFKFLLVHYVICGSNDCLSHNYRVGFTTFIREVLFCVKLFWFSKIVQTMLAYLCSLQFEVQLSEIQLRNKDFCKFTVKKRTEEQQIIITRGLNWGSVKMRLINTVSANQTTRNSYVL